MTAGPEGTIGHAPRTDVPATVKRNAVIDAGWSSAGTSAGAAFSAVFDRPPEDIRREVNAQVLFDQVHGDPGRLSVAVKDGVVTLAGTPETEAIGREIVDQTRHIPGVVADATASAIRRSIPATTRASCSRPTDARTRLRGDSTMNTTVKDIMTAKVVAVKRGASFKEMAGLLRRFRVSAFPSSTTTRR